MTSEFDPREYRYFYIVYTMGGNFTGATMLKQKRVTDGSPDFGFNIASAYQHIFDALEHPAIIMSWTEVEYIRYCQWTHFLKKHENKGNHLSSHPGGNQGERKKSKASLKSLDPEE